MVRSARKQGYAQDSQPCMQDIPGIPVIGFLGGLDLADLDIEPVDALQYCESSNEPLPPQGLNCSFLPKSRAVDTDLNPEPKQLVQDSQISKQRACSWHGIWCAQQTGREPGMTGETVGWVKAVDHVYRVRLSSSEFCRSLRLAFVAADRCTLTLTCC